MKKNRFSFLKILVLLNLFSVSLNFPRILEGVKYKKRNHKKRLSNYYLIKSFNHPKKVLSKKKIKSNLLKKWKNNNNSKKRNQEKRELKRKSIEFKKYVKKIKNYS